jgi:dehydrodolichyl diphosphate syntase complex subunit NUS1
MPRSKEESIYRKDARKGGTLLTPKERENLIKPYLPVPAKLSTTAKSKRKPIRTFLKTWLHILVYTIIHALFSLYVRLRSAYHNTLSTALSILYYHHRTPELIRKDVHTLSRLPKHLSVILELNTSSQSAGTGDGSGLDQLLDEVAEISAWCACVGIPLLSVYEKTGILKNYIPTTHRTVAAKFHAYFGAKRPSLQVRAPHMQAFLNGDIKEWNDAMSSTTSGGQSPEASEAGGGTATNHLSLLLLSSSDARATLVDLTKTLAEMNQARKLLPSDISQELIEAEISESVMGEPDLLILFSPRVRLEGYPPWQLRLTEIYHVRDNNGGVEYLVWLRGLHRFAKAQMRFGR